MSELVLVRHGQARAFTQSPDQLSSAGWVQSRRLGRYWASAGVRWDAAFHGSLRRQRETYQAVAEEYRAANQPFPPAREEPGFNEYQVQDLLTAIASKPAKEDRTFLPLWEEWEQHREGENRLERPSHPVAKFCPGLHVR